MTDPADRPLRLVHCTNEIGAGGGIATINEQFYRHLDRSLVDPVFLGTSDFDPKAVPYAGEIPYIFTDQERRFEQLAAHFREADIVQFYGAFDPVVCEAAARTGVPILIELLHNMEVGGIYRNIDLSCCVSRAVWNMQTDAVKRRLIPNGIDLTHFPERAETRPRERFVVLQSARRDKVMHCQIEDLAGDLLSLHPGLEIWIMGAGQDRPGTDRVKYLGFQRDVGAVYREADLLLHLSRQESFGLAVAEAMASGCLPLVADEGGPAEIVDSGQTGWAVPGGERERVLAAVRRAFELRPTPQWRDMQSAARRHIVQNHTVERFIEAHHQAYRELARAKGRRRQPGGRPGQAPPEVHLATALHRYHGQRLPEMIRAIDRFNQDPAPLHHPGVAYAAVRLAGFLRLHKAGEMAHRIYQKLYRSGFRDLEWMLDWLGVFPENCPDPFPVHEILKRDPTQPDALLLAAEQALDLSDYPTAIIHLATYLDAHPGTGPVRDAHKQLKFKYFNSLSKAS